MTRFCKNFNKHWLFENLKSKDDIMNWQPLKKIPEIKGGDMPGDVCLIKPVHLDKANCMFPKLWEQLQNTLTENAHGRAVVSICGGSGTGKTECAQLIVYMLQQLNVRAYALSGDNYPYRIPKYNDAERLNIFRNEGIRELLALNIYSDQVCDELKVLQKADKDSDPAEVEAHPWLARYQQAGDAGLKSYLGTHREHDFAGLSAIITQFKAGANSIYLKRMGREETSCWYECVDFSNTSVLIVEWTHGNSDNLRGIDIPVLLYSTPEETLAHRKARGRDKGADSPFTTRVLNIEGEMLRAQAHRAKIIVSNKNTLMEALP